MLSNDIVFEPDRRLFDLVSTATIGQLRQVDKMNIIKNASDTSLKCVSESRQRRCCQSHEQTGGIHVLQDVHFHSSSSLLQERSWSNSSRHSSISNNSFYSSTQSLYGTAEDKIINSIRTTHDCFPHRHEHFSKKSASKTSDAIYIPTRELPHLSQFVSCKHRSPCVIPDIAIVEDMRIVLLDHYHNNVQMFSENFEFIEEVHCEFPMAICSLGAGLVAVTKRRDSMLAIFQTSDHKISFLRNLPVPCKFYLWQVAFKQEKLFVVCDENNIHVMDTSGVALSKISSGVPTEHGFIRNFDVSDDATRLYLCERSGLRCISATGEFKWRFSQTDLPEWDRNAQGLVIEDIRYFNGFLFGSLWQASKLIMLSDNGHLLCYVVTTGLDHPRAIAVRGDRLVVTQFSPSIRPVKNRTVHVFSIEDLFSSDSKEL